MNALAFLVLLQSEPLPIDAAMTAYEAAVPSLKQIQAETEEQVGRLGPIQPGWGRTGSSAATAISLENGTVAQHVLGEWEKGGHGVMIPDDRPFRVPAGYIRYAVRGYGGPINYHAYHRVAEGIVIHTFGYATKAENAECQRTEGVELFSRSEWRDWEPQTAVTVFGGTRAIRDDNRMYCLLYRPVADGGFAQVAYTAGGQPYVAGNEDPQVFKVTSRTEAAARIFAN